MLLAKAADLLVIPCLLVEAVLHGTCGHIGCPVHASGLKHAGGVCLMQQGPGTQAVPALCLMTRPPVHERCPVQFDRDDTLMQEEPRS